MPQIHPEEDLGGGGGGGDDQIAAEVPYSPGITGLTGTNVQTAISELASLSLIQDVTITGNYTVLSGDELILVDHTLPATITLPAVPQEHKIYRIKDKSGDASTNNITVSGNGNTIDGSPTFLMTADYQAMDFIFDGSDWNAI